MAQPSNQRQLCKSAREALREYGIIARRIVQVASRHNDVFRVIAVSGKRYVLRIQNDQLSDQEVELQLAWLDAMKSRTNLRIPATARTLDGRAFTRVEIEGTVRRVLLLDWVEGRVAARRDDQTYRYAAALLAQMHSFAERFDRPTKRACRALDADWLFGPRFFLHHTRATGALNAAERKVAQRTETFVSGAMKRLGRGSRRFGLIHADLNLDNIVFYRGDPAPIDFDEFGAGWYLFDLAELIRTSINPKNWMQRKTLAVSAYAASRTLDKTEIECFDAFIAATFMQYLNWTFLHARNDADLKWVSFCIEVLQQVESRESA